MKPDGAENFPLVQRAAYIEWAHLLTSTLGIPSPVSGSKVMGQREKCKGELFENS